MASVLPAALLWRSFFFFPLPLAHTHTQVFKDREAYRLVFSDSLSAPPLCTHTRTHAHTRTSFHSQYCRPLFYSFFDLWGMLSSLSLSLTHTHFLSLAHVLAFFFPLSLSSLSLSRQIPLGTPSQKYLSLSLSLSLSLYPSLAPSLTLTHAPFFLTLAHACLPHCRSHISSFFTCFYIYIYPRILLVA